MEAKVDTDSSAQNCDSGVIGRPFKRGFDERRNLAGRPPRRTIYSIAEEELDKVDPADAEGRTHREAGTYVPPTQDLVEPLFFTRFIAPASARQRERHEQRSVSAASTPSESPWRRPMRMRTSDG